MTTNPQFGIIYFSDSSKDIFALSYICKSVAAGNVVTPGALKNIHICDSG